MERLESSFENTIVRKADIDAEDREIIEIAEKVKQRRIRQASAPEAGKSRHITAEEKTDLQEDCSSKNSVYLTTPSQLSEISSIIESVITNEDGKF